MNSLSAWSMLYVFANGSMPTATVTYTPSPSSYHKQVNRSIYFHMKGIGIIKIDDRFAILKIDKQKIVTTFETHFCEK